MFTRGLLILLTCGAFAVGAAGCAANPTRSASSGTSGSPASASAAVPAGFVIREGDGFVIAIPKEWSDIPAKMRTNPKAAMEVGIPFTGQPTIPPSLTGWVDRGEYRGSATIQAQLAQAKIRSELQDAKFTSLEDVQVSGAISAVWFDYTYHMKAAKSVLGTQIKAADYRIRDLTVQVKGKPQFGFRYAATESDFDEDVWKTMLESLSVQADQ